MHYTILRLPEDAALPERILKGLLAALFIYQLVVLLLWLNTPILDRHGFRQTQTALSAFWMFREFDFLKYITPVLGFPWAIPMEFPIYQFLAAIVAELTPLDTTASCRVVAWGFGMAVAWPLAKILYRYSGDRQCALTGVCLYLAVPFYTFWNRTAMIESTALFFSILCFWSLIRLGDTPSLRLCIAAACLGMLAALTKVTTIPAFMVAGYAHIVWVNRAALFANKTRLLCFFIPGAVSLLAVFLWNMHADGIKEANPIGVGLTSSALTNWNFGTLQQRLRSTTWLSLGWRHIQAFTPVLFVITSIAAIFCWSVQTRLMKMAALFSLVLCALPLLIFTNLHHVHDYYQCANMIFAVAALAFVMGSKLPAEYPGKYRLAQCAVVCALCIALAAVFFKVYGNSIRHAIQSDIPLIGGMVRQKTPHDSAILGFGVGWSSEYVYYSERKGLTVPEGWSLSTRDVDGMLSTGIGGLPVSALIVCYPQNIHQRQQETIAYILESGVFAEEALTRDCRLYLRK